MTAASFAVIPDYQATATTAYHQHLNSVLDTQVVSMATLYVVIRNFRVKLDEGVATVRITFNKTKELIDWR